jgi:protein involved in polysaccharide export with SLBB domain
MTILTSQGKFHYRHALLCLAAFLGWAVRPGFGQADAKPDYILNNGDSVEIRFSYNAEMNDRVTIRPDGYISMAMIGDLQAGGKTPAQLSADITASYRRFLRNPEAVVVVREFANRRVYVSGEVQTPGVLTLSGPLTVAQAVASSGGAKAAAALDSALLLRYRGTNKASVQVVKLKQILKGKADDFLLQPFDVIYLPRTAIAKLDLFVDQYINSLVPKSLLFPYNISNVYTVSAK